MSATSEQKKDWERRLYILLGEMQEANGPMATRVESAVDIAWVLASHALDKEGTNLGAL